MEPATVPDRPAKFAASGVVTLTTDFGLQDPFVGVMKGQLVARFAAVRIIDVTHEIPAHWPAEAGFWLARAFRYFPAGTVHVAVVDPGVGSAREIAMVEADGHLFLAPDNGLLAPVFDSAATATARHVAPGTLARLGIHAPSATFHGRDILAPLAAALAEGRLAPEHVGPQVDALVPGWIDDPVATVGQVTGTVVTIDHFGNLITNIEQRHLQGLAHPVVRVGGREVTVRRTYSDVRPGDYLALVNSFGVLEIARAERSAAEGLGLARGAPVVVLSK
jgi:S-adenosylmethionine hydrolase